MTAEHYSKGGPFYMQGPGRLHRTGPNQAGLWCLPSLLPSRQPPLSGLSSYPVCVSPSFIHLIPMAFKYPWAFLVEKRLHFLSSCCLLSIYHYLQRVLPRPPELHVAWFRGWQALMTWPLSRSCCCGRLLLDLVLTLVFWDTVLLVFLLPLATLSGLV